jgi:hypothetical protein
MHNTPEEKILRLSTWSTFGASNFTGADYCAFESFGPVNPALVKYSIQTNLPSEPNLWTALFSEHEEIC